MKTHFCLIVSLLFAIGSIDAQLGRMGGPPPGPGLSGSTAKLFGDNSTFSANLEMQTGGQGDSESMIIPGKIFFDAVVTDKDGTKHESTVWNATDLKKFPVKIEHMENGTKVTMLFHDVNLSKPSADLFEPPADSTKYDSTQSMMQQQMMKRFGGAAGSRPPRDQ